MKIDELVRINLQRCERWHPDGIEEWSALEWAGAMAGEAGEAANSAKKLRRIELGMKSIEASHLLTDEQLQRHNIAKECADTILYALLLMKRVGVESPATVIADVFDEKSIQYGFSERAPRSEATRVDGEQQP